MEPGTARGQWARPAPAPCHLHPSSVAHPHKLQTCTHSPAFSLGLSLLNTGAPLPPSSYSTPTFQCVCLSRAQSLSLSLSHTLACYFSCAAHCEDVCGQISMALAGRAGGSALVLVLILRGDRAGVSGHMSNNSPRGR